MHAFARTAGAFVAAVALGAAATPAHAASLAPPTVVGASTAQAQDEPSERFNPGKCSKRSYFREHRAQCIRYFRYLEERADRGRDREPFGSRDRDRDRYDRGEDDRRGPDDARGF